MRRKHIPGAKARIVQRALDVRAKARTYLRGKCNDKSRRKGKCKGKMRGFFATLRMTSLKGGMTKSGGAG
jgi:hypothetical protein